MSTAWHCCTASSTVVGAPGEKKTSAIGLTMALFPENHVGARQGPPRLVVIVARKPDLLEVVHALDAPRGFAGRLHGGQKQGDEDGNDGDDHQQLDQGESTMMGTRTHKHLSRKSRILKKNNDGAALTGRSANLP